jgi:hypothetical protein
LADKTKYDHCSSYITVRGLSPNLGWMKINRIGHIAA